LGQLKDGTIGLAVLKLPDVIGINLPNSSSFRVRAILIHLCADIGEKTGSKVSSVLAPKKN